MVVGIDRELRDKPAGLRTHMLVSLAAASFTLISFDFHARLIAQGNDNADPIRALEAVVAGVAFLGAGTIIQSANKVRGVTTGAGMWMAGAIGLACGGGLFAIAILLTGAIFVLRAITGMPGVGRGLDTGGTFYTPYSTDPNSALGGAAAALMGVFILGFSSIFTGLNFIVTIHRLRPPGMTWFRMPLFLWALYATALIQVLATPVIGITVALLTLERLTHIGIFDPAYGGDPVLYQHFFWFYSHPAVYIMILPGMGIISELIAVHSHRHIFGYKFIAFSSIAIASKTRSRLRSRAAKFMAPITPIQSFDFLSKAIERNRAARRTASPKP